MGTILHVISVINQASLGLLHSSRPCWCTKSNKWKTVAEYSYKNKRKTAAEHSYKNEKLWQSIHKVQCVYCISIIEYRKCKQPTWLFGLNQLGLLPHYNCHMTENFNNCHLTDNYLRHLPLHLISKDFIKHLLGRGSCGLFGFVN